MELFSALVGNTICFLNLKNSHHDLLLQSAERSTAKQQRSLSKAMNPLKDHLTINFSEGSTGLANVAISFIDND
jgi:hypothetical protein